ncbi:MAG: DNA starvation/stationary phase protection protein Dps [Candidatus Tectomicrobia bacterium]|uniref:DNA starvation/stationary phase protection protein Dps n=1 Tax=Tectimicrobiota bacterium TaxID=2528274 RepID=A0A932MNJ3_UNCTE|nr:DNA starvation/stationary phase protection protein Dps [Candidatus Tectomicrobia bacterium]
MATQADKLHRTANDLPAETRKEIIPLLQASLADTLDLQTHMRQAHWNLKGPNFYSLHKLFDEVVASAGIWIDEIGERIVMLGGQARGTARAAAAETRLPDYPLDITAERDHLQAAVASLSTYCGSTRDCIGACQDLGDETSAHIFIETSRAVDKYLWFAEAHLQ